MADDDMFLDQERLKKMIALGIYDDNMAGKVKNIKNKDLVDKTPQARPPDPPMDTSSGPPMGMSRGGGRGGGRGRQEFGRDLQTDGNEGWSPMGRQFRSGFTANSAYKWSVVGEDRHRGRGRGRGQHRSYNQMDDRSSGDGYRDGFRNSIRDGIQDKIQRNESDRQMNIDQMREKYSSGNHTIDTDLRPKPDTDLRRAADSRRQTADNLSLNTFADFDNDEDFRGGGGDRGDRRFDHKPMPRPPLVDDLDDFIQMASAKLNESLSPLKRKNRSEESDPDLDRSRQRQYEQEMRRGGGGRGRGGDRGGGRGGGPPQRRPEDLFPQRPKRTDVDFDHRNDRDFGNKEPQNDYNSRPPKPSFERPRRLSPIERRLRPEPEVAADVPTEAEEDVSRDIAILRQTVEELSKSNLYCHYCDHYLSSTNDIDAHLGSLIHQQNMAKKEMQDNAKVDSDGRFGANERADTSRTVVDRVPTGMAALVQMIDSRKQITLTSLTDMDTYAICSESEALLAKELAKLLTQELLNYKMSSMPDTVKEALKNQGIGLLNTMTKS